MNTTDTFLYYSIAVLIWLEFFWELYLSYRQYKVVLKNTQIPTELIGILPQKTFDKARLYALDRNRYGMVVDAFTFLSSMAVLFCNILPTLWEVSDNTIRRLGFETGEISQSAVFVMILNGISSLSLLPFSIYNNFVLEEKHGFNKQTMGFFLRDKLKVHILTQVIMIPLLSVVIYIVRIGGDYFFLYAWFFVVCATLFLYTIHPDFIAPLFDKYTPLPEGNLKTEIEKLASSVGFPLYKICVIQGSKRSAHSNAFIFGAFKSKRIVLFDTLIKGLLPEMAKSDDEKAESEREEEKGKEKEKEIEKEKDYENENEKKKEEAAKGCDTMEVLAVVGHEMGHWKYHHIAKRMGVMQANLLVILVFFSYVFQYKPLYEAFGFHNSMPVVIGLLLVIHFVCVPYFTVLSLAMAVMSRQFEFQADRFAKSLGRAQNLKCSLIKLNVDNLGFPVFDPLYSAWHNSHPPLLERLQALDKDE